MSNLLEKASIITTPTAYSNGFIHSVKPSESPYADFTFTRNSEATRVNSQGLVESVQILGSNVVTNGDFSQIGSELITNGDFATNTDWTLVGSATISNGRGNLVSVSDKIYQEPTLSQGKIYKITFDVVNYTTGNLRVFLGSTGDAFLEVSSNGSYIAYLKSIGGIDKVQFRSSGGVFVGAITNVSVVEIIDWTVIGDGWSFGGNKASCDGTQTDVTNLIQAISTNIQNQLVKISFTLDISAGTLSGSLNNSGGTEFDALTTSGNYSVEATSGDANPTILFQGNADFIGSISNVVIKSVTNDTDLPRINYENGCGSWLLEPQTTNLLPYSEDFSQWTTTSGVTITPSYKVSPNSEVDSSRFLTTGNNFLYKVITLPSISEYTFSIWVKSNQNSLDNFAIHINGNNSSVFTATSNWQRFQHTFTSSNASHNFGLVGQAGGTDVEIWGAQLEQKSFTTSYIPTVGSTRTRNQDLAINAGNSDLINSTEGVLYAEIARDANGAASGGIQIDDGTVNNSIRMFFNQTNTISVITRVNNVNTVVRTAQPITSSTDINKFALRYKLNDYKMYYNGSELWSRTSNALVWPVGTLDNIDFQNQTTPFNGKLKCVAVFKEALTDAELAALTTT